MSRIGKLPVVIPAGVEVTISENNFVTVKGPKGSLEKQMPTPVSYTHLDVYKRQRTERSSSQSESFLR